MKGTSTRPTHTEKGLIDIAIMARPNIRAKSRWAVSKARPPQETASKPANAESTTRPKQQKREQKRSALLSRAQTSAVATGRHSAGIKKRRRPARKLTGADAAGLNKLASALDDALTEPSSSTATVQPASRAKQPQLTPTTSLKSKPGLQRRRENINRLEQNRFSKNLAVMNAPQSSSTTTQSQTGAEHSRAERWAALRQHISSAMPKT